jgi:hypothetical protein
LESAAGITTMAAIRTAFTAATGVDIMGGTTAGITDLPGLRKLALPASPGRQGHLIGAEEHPELLAPSTKNER